MFSMAELAAALFKAYGITSGLWQLGCELRFSGTTAPWQEIGSSDKDSFPTAMIGIAGIGLKPADRPGVLVFDAAEVNPPSTPTKRAPAVKRTKSKA